MVLKNDINVGHRKSYQGPGILPQPVVVVKDSPDEEAFLDMDDPTRASTVDICRDKAAMTFESEFS